MKFNILCLPIVALTLFLNTRANSQTTKTVTTYITETQDKRESTRFTLTEWLRIKERMKMMDVWLAMFSKPESKFEPELFLGYGFKKGNIQFNDNQLAGQTKVANEGSQAKMQLWLTNLISSTTGLRSLNIDFGLEGFANGTDKLVASTAGNSLTPGKRLTTQATANFRLFGKNIQDSYLVLKCGSYSTKDQANPPTLPSQPTTGIVAGGELALYLFKWLGVGANYFNYGTQSSLSSARSRGTYYDYQAFIEISVLRMMVGQYQESFNATENGIDFKTTNNGQLIGAELLF